MSPSNIGIYASQISGHLFAPSGAYDSIATTTVGSGGASNISFTSIPATYTHLQIRGIGKQATTTANGPSLYYNGVSTGTSYAFHNLYGNGANAFANAFASQPYDSSMSLIGNGSNFTAFVIDILDYANTNKYKTTRALTGLDANGSGQIYLHSNVFMSNNAISQIEIFNGYVWQQYTQFALYGIKGA
jgi:hypothetical protein